MTQRALSIARQFVGLASEAGEPMTNMRLHKLLYFAQGHALALRGEVLIDEAVEAWRYGPVFPSVFEAWKEYGAEPIPVCEGRPLREGHAHSEIVDAVWQAYRRFSPVRLSQMAMVPRGPWAQARNDYPNAPVRSAHLAEYFQAA